MTNYDMYKDEILKRKHTKYNKCLNSMGYAVASICGTYDLVEMLEWLFEEYKPIMLKNGDGLQPGDWIMVQDEFDDSWKKRAFVAYYDGHFIAVRGGYKIGEHNEVEYARQARLPMEGE